MSKGFHWKDLWRCKILILITYIVYILIPYYYFYNSFLKRLFWHEGTHNEGFINNNCSVINTTCDVNLTNFLRIYHVWQPTGVIDIRTTFFFSISMSVFPINTSIYILLRHTNYDTNETKYTTDLFPKNILFKSVYWHFRRATCSCETTSAIISQN